jgi:hypothetical protein
MMVSAGAERVQYHAANSILGKEITHILTFTFLMLIRMRTAVLAFSRAQDFQLGRVWVDAARARRVSWAAKNQSNNREQEKTYGRQINQH